MINQPAGHVENGETLQAAIIREVFEETAYKFSPDEISGIYQWQHDNGETYLRVCFTGQVYDHQPEQALDAGIIQSCWLSLDEIESKDNLRSPLVTQCISDYLAGYRYPLSLIQNIN